VRRLLSIPLVLAGVLAIAFGSVLWWIDQQIFDTATVVDHSHEILAKPAVQAELRTAIVNQIVLIVGTDRLKSPIDDMVKLELADPVFQRDFTDSIAVTQQSLVDPTVPIIRLDLSAVAVHLAAQLQAKNPVAAQQVAAQTGSLRFDLIDRTQLPREWLWAERWHNLGLFYLGLGIALVAVGIAVGPGRWGLTVTTGIGLVVLCGASVLGMKWAVAKAVASTATPTDKAAIKDLAQPFIADLTVQSVVIGVIGLLIALVGAGLGVMGVGRVPTNEWSPPPSFRQANWR